jgi:hypothetical protein
MKAIQQERPGQHDREAAADAWGARKADQAARRAATMADPVDRFHLLHGRRRIREAAPSATETGGGEPGPA